MKRIVGIGLACLALASVALAGPKAVKDYTGSISISVTDTARVSGTHSIAVSDILNGNVWDRMSGVVTMLDMTSDTATGIGETDTLIVTLIMTAPYRKDTLRVDTLHPGAVDTSTGFKRYDFYRQDQTLDTIKDSSGVVFTDVYYENVDWLSLGLDQLVIDWQMRDSAAVGGTATGSIKYWFRFFDED